MKIVGSPSALRSAVLQRLTGLNPAPLFTEDIEIENLMQQLSA
jgi:hypothetical protein